MAWYDTHQAAVDPDNPAANEQITFDEWNAMVTYLKDKIIDKAVNDAAIGNDKVLVYKTATSTFVFEAQSAVGAIDDLTDVTISGVPADNEVLAYDTGTSEWINQTAAEAGLATVAGLAAYYPLSGATLTGNLNMGDYLLDDVDDIQAYDTGGINFRDNAGSMQITLASSTHSFVADANASMGGTYQIQNMADPTSAQHASTKNYDDTHLFTKEAVTSFTDGYIPVYRTASGKFEMEDAGGSAGLPVADTTNIVKGSADGTKLMRFEADGITTGTTRVMTVPDKDITLCDVAEVMLLSGTQAMGATLNMGTNFAVGYGMKGYSDSLYMTFMAGPSSYSSLIALHGITDGGNAGNVECKVTNAALTGSNTAWEIEGATDTPIIDIYFGLNMKAKNIDDIGALILNDPTELTIAAGVVTVTQSYHNIDTESDDATDDLSTISGGSAGQILVISAIDGARTVVVKTSATISLSGSDFTMDNARDTLTLICIMAGYWKELARANNGA